MNSDGPPWIRDAVAVAADEVRRFLATAFGFMRRPGRFSAAWLTGEQRALNPLGFVATALAISSAAGALVSTDSDGGSGVVSAIAFALLPYCYYAAIGIAAHPLLRLGGSRRRLSASIAVALFAGGGPGLVATLSWYLAVALRVAITGTANGPLMRGVPHWAWVPMGLLIGAPFTFFLVTLTLGLAGLHAIQPARAAAAVLVSVCALGVLLGVLHTRIHFWVGVPNLVITFRHYEPIPDLWF